MRYDAYERPILAEMDFVGTDLPGITRQASRIFRQAAGFDEDYHHVFLSEYEVEVGTLEFDGYAKAGGEVAVYTWKAPCRLFRKEGS